MAIDELAFYFELEHLNSSWEKLDELTKPKNLQEAVFEAEAAERLKLVLSETMRFRLQTYFFYKKQQEQMSGLKINFNEINEENDIHLSLSENEMKRITFIYQILIPLDKLLFKFLEGNENAFINTLLFDSSYYTQGVIAKRLCQYELAVKYFLQAKESITKEYSYKYFRILDSLGDAYRQLGEFKEALKYLKKLENNWEESKGKKKFEQSTLFNHIAITYYELGKFKKARTYQQQALKIHEEKNEREDISCAYMVLGMIFHDTGEYDQSLEFYSMALDIRNEICTPDSSSVANCHNALGVLYGDWGKYEKAERHFNRALLIWRKLYGSWHPNVAKCLNNLASVFSGQSKFEESNKLLMRVIQINAYIFGDSNKVDGEIFLNLGSNYLKLGSRYIQEAQYYSKKALKILKHDNFNHHNVALVLCNICQCYLTLKELDLAKKYCDKAYSIIQKLSTSHPVSGFIYYNYGEINFNRKELNSALRNYQSALNIFKKIYNSHHPHIVQCLLKIESITYGLLSQDKTYIHEVQLQFFFKSVFYNPNIRSFDKYYDSSKYITDAEQVNLAKINMLLLQQGFNYQFEGDLRLNKNYFLDGILEVNIDKIKEIQVYLINLNIPSQIINFTDKTCLVIEDINDEAAKIIQDIWDKYKVNQNKVYRT